MCIMDAREKYIEEYIVSHSDSEPLLLKKLQRDAHLHLLRPRMIAGHLQGRLLKMFVHMICPKHVLEIGTYTGYSAICLAEGLPEGGHLYTIEINDEMEDFIRKYLDQSEQKEKYPFSSVMHWILFLHLRIIFSIWCLSMPIKENIGNILRRFCQKFPPEDLSLSTTRFGTAKY